MGLFFFWSPKAEADHGQSIVRPGRQSHKACRLAGSHARTLAFTRPFLQPPAYTAQHRARRGGWAAPRSAKMSLKPPPARPPAHPPLHLAEQLLHAAAHGVGVVDVHVVVLACEGREGGEGPCMVRSVVHSSLVRCALPRRVEGIGAHGVVLACRAQRGRGFAR